MVSTAKQKLQGKQTPARHRHQADTHTIKRQDQTQLHPMVPPNPNTQTARRRARNGWTNAARATETNVRATCTHSASADKGSQLQRPIQAA